MKWNLWSLYWSVWLFLLFGVPEGIALATGHPENTLSDQVWHLEGTGATFWRYVVFAVLFWLLIHMVWRKFT
jgi:hypothetical protein